MYDKFAQPTSCEQAEQLYTQTFIWSGDMLDDVCATPSSQQHGMWTDGQQWSLEWLVWTCVN